MSEGHALPGGTGAAAAVPAVFPGTDPDPEGLAEDPWTVVRAWLPENAEDQRPLICLSTLDEEGYPDSRHVLLTAVEETGFCFHTATSTRKAAQLQADPRAVISIAWAQEGKQLTVQGEAHATDAEEARAAFRRRSDYLKTLAWISSEETAQLPAEQRHRIWAEAQHSVPSQEPPASWIGFRLIPRRFTFWRGDDAGPSRRTEYSAAQGGWDRRQLPG